MLIKRIRLQGLQWQVTCPHMATPRNRSTKKRFDDRWDEKPQATNQKPKAKKKHAPKKYNCSYVWSMEYYVTTILRRRSGNSRILISSDSNDQLVRVTT